MNISWFFQTPVLLLAIQKLTRDVTVGTASKWLMPGEAKLAFLTQCIV